jgi:transcriptional regulator with XRE-family HTH domain
MAIEKRNLTDVERFEQSSTEDRRLLNQEKLILGVTEALSEAIEERGLTRSEVAKRLGKTKGFVSQLLAGGRNLTLRTVADIADAIGISLKVAVHGTEISRNVTRLRRKDLSVQTAPRRRLSRIT